MARKLTIYFQNMADVLDQKKKISEVLPNTSDSGTTREGILKQFLIEHLPTRCKVISGGFIFNSQDEESSQIDLIILHDLTLQFNSLESLGQKAFAAIEGCLAAFSVKTILDKKELKNSLDGFATIPKMPKLNINPDITLGNTDYPARMIFAFSGLKPETIVSHLEEYYKENPTPVDEKVKLIVVNNEYIIIRITKNTTSQKGKFVPDGSFFIGRVTNEFRGAYCLHYLITDLQNYSNITPHIFLNFKEYLDNTLRDYR